MRKHIKKWVKDEKRIIKLMHRAGLLADFNINEFYWESYRPYRFTYVKEWGRVPTSYYPEIHFSVRDYWGDHDECCVSDSVQEALYWANIIGDQSDCCDIPDSTYKKKNREDFIRFLTQLPKVVNDSKINKVLNRGFNC